jgi:hypothetical protein
VFPCLSVPGKGGGGVGAAGPSIAPIACTTTHSLTDSLIHSLLLQSVEPPTSPDTHSLTHSPIPRPTTIGRITKPVPTPGATRLTKRRLVPFVTAALTAISFQGLTTPGPKVGGMWSVEWRKCLLVWSAMIGRAGVSKRLVWLGWVGVWGCWLVGWVVGGWVDGWIVRVYVCECMID